MTWVISLFGWLVRFVAGSWRSTAGWFVWEKNTILTENLRSFTTSHSQTNRLNFFQTPRNMSFRSTLWGAPWILEVRSTFLADLSWWSWSVWLEKLGTELGRLSRKITWKLCQTPPRLQQGHVVFFSHLHKSGIFFVYSMYKFVVSNGIKVS